MMDLYDAQMLDYSGDSDIQMHASVSSPKPWLPHEALMEDDVNPQPNVFATASPFPQQDVEIDMEPEYVDTVEYEMADDGDLATSGGELVDVDVYDGSLMPEADSSAIPPVPSHNEVPMAAADSSMDDHLVTFSGAVDPVAVEVHSPPPDHVDIAASYESESGVPTGSSPDIAVQDSSRIPSHPEVADESAKPVDNDGVQPSVEDSHLVGGGGLDAASQAEKASESSIHSNAAVLDQHVDDSPAIGPVVHDPQPEPILPIDHNEAEVGSVLHPSEHLEPEASHTVEGVPAQASTNPEDATNQQLEVDGGTDPHEISEGVYIDPPPPVLLDIPSSSDQPECCLFNAPTRETGLHSPKPETSPEDQKHFTILLRQRPTLYYERLSDVFDALRQEERIQHIPGLIEGELVFDAYDLQLVISEDNIFAREVTLHDLNILHDGSDFTGPLRLHLRSVTPRFIDRYRSLRYQIDRLNLADDGGETYDVVPEHEYYEPGTDEHHPELSVEHHEEYPEGTEDDQGGDAAKQGSYEDDGRDQEADYEHPEADVALVTEDSGEFLGDKSHPVADNHEYHEVPEEEAHGLEGEGDYTEAFDYSNVTIVEAEVDVYSSAAHEGADTDAFVGVGAGSTEYEEYAELHEEDEANADAYSGEALAGEESDRDASGDDELGYIDNTQEAVPEGFPESSVESVSQEISDAHQDFASNAAQVLIDAPQHVNIHRGREEAVDQPDEIEGDTEDDYTDGTTSEFAGEISISVNDAPKGSKADSTSVFADTETNFSANSTNEIEQIGEFDEDWQQEEQDWDENYDEEALDLEPEPDTGFTDTSTLSSKASSKRAFDEVDAEDEQDQTDQHLDAASPKRPRTQ